MLHSCDVRRLEFPSWEVVLPTSLCSCALRLSGNNMDAPQGAHPPNQYWV